jgi:dihydrofolate reductase
VVVPSHGVPEDVPEDGVYTFVHDLGRALELARETAGERNISVMGADVGGQFLRAGLVDVISVHLVPVLFGSGLRMFDHVVDEHVTLELEDVSGSPHATHLRYGSSATSSRSPRAPPDQGCGPVVGRCSPARATCRPLAGPRG